MDKTSAESRALGLFASHHTPYPVTLSLGLVQERPSRRYALAIDGRPFLDAKQGTISRSATKFVDATGATMCLLKTAQSFSGSGTARLDSKQGSASLKWAQRGRSTFELVVDLPRNALAPADADAHPERLTLTILSASGTGDDAPPPSYNEATMPGGAHANVLEHNGRPVAHFNSLSPRAAEVHVEPGMDACLVAVIAVMAAGAARAMAAGKWDDPEPVAPRRRSAVGYRGRVAARASDGGATGYVFDWSNPGPSTEPPRTQRVPARASDGTPTGYDFDWSNRPWPRIPLGPTVGPFRSVFD